MADIQVQIGGRNYQIACEDGQEAHLAAAAELITREARALASQFGPIDEARLLLMSGLMVSDKLRDRNEQVAELGMLVEKLRKDAEMAAIASESEPQDTETTAETATEIQQAFFDDIEAEVEAEDAEEDQLEASDAADASSFDDADDVSELAQIDPEELAQAQARIAELEAELEAARDAAETQEEELAEARYMAADAEARARRASEALADAEKAAEDAAAELAAAKNPAPMAAANGDAQAQGFVPLSPEEAEREAAHLETITELRARVEDVRRERNDVRRDLMMAIAILQEGTRQMTNLSAELGDGDDAEDPAETQLQPV